MDKWNVEWNVGKGNVETRGTRILFSSGPSLIHTAEGIPQNLSKFYFQVEILKGLPDDECAHIYIGLTTKEAWKRNIFPGNDMGTIGYSSIYCQSNDCKCGEIKQDGEVMVTTTSIKEGDIVGFDIQCINVDNITYVSYQYTKNAEDTGHRLYLQWCDIYPTVGVCVKGVEIDIQLGYEPFNFHSGITTILIYIYIYIYIYNYLNILTININTLTCVLS